MIGIVLVILSTCLGYYHKTEYNKKKSVCASLFNIFPEECFRKEEVQEYLKKSNII